MENKTLVMAIVSSFKTAHPRDHLGRTALQKLCYFARELGVPFDYRFRLYHYGPYCSELEDDAVALQIDGLLEDASSNPHYSDYKLTRAGQTRLGLEKASIQDYMDKIKTVARGLGSLKPEQLELLATVKFASDSTTTDREGVINLVKSVKGDKFDDATIGGTYDALKKAGLIT